MTSPHDPEEPRRKGRSNAILTYETVSNIEKHLIQLSAQLSNMEEKFEAQRQVHIDHEVRIRALELTAARGSGSTGMARWLYGAAGTAVGLVLAALAYFQTP